MLQVTFNPGLTLTGFRTTRPRRVSSVLNLFLTLKFAEYPCFYVVLAGSLHFPKEKYFFLYYLFVCLE